MLFELATGNTPFYHPRSKDNSTDRISERILKEQPRMPRYFSSELKDVVRKVTSDASRSAPLVLLLRAVVGVASGVGIC